MPSNFRGGVLFVDSPDPNHPRACRLSRGQLNGISEENKEIRGRILQNLHGESMTIEQAADLVRELGAEYYIRICATPDDLISTIEQILSSRVNSWDNGGKHAWDDHGYFVNTFWRE